MSGCVRVCTQRAPRNSFSALVSYLDRTGIIFFKLLSRKAVIVTAAARFLRLRNLKFRPRRNGCAFPILFFQMSPWTAEVYRSISCFCHSALCIAQQAKGVQYLRNVQFSVSEVTPHAELVSSHSVEVDATPMEWNGSPRGRGVVMVNATLALSFVVRSLSPATPSTGSSFVGGQWHFLSVYIHTRSGCT
jgi:hypothetical protein